MLTVCQQTLLSSGPKISFWSLPEEAAVMKVEILANKDTIVLKPVDGTPSLRLGETGDTICIVEIRPPCCVDGAAAGARQESPTER